MNKTSLKEKRTRFRAYQLGTEGSSFSYFDGTHFTLVEARLNDVNGPRLQTELKECQVKTLACLHITSWDADHCARSDLEQILKSFKPSEIQYPGYPPHTDTAEECLEIIKEYGKRDPTKKIQCVDPAYIKSLGEAEQWGYTHVLFHPRDLSEKSNDNSTVKLFRTGAFNAASLGDVESQGISSYLKNCKTFYQETDILILAHHGADDEFTTSSFLRKVRPTAAVCSSNYDSQFEHPKPRIRDLLHKYGIPLYTTKTGDIVVVSVPPHSNKYKVFNLISDSQELSSEKEFTSKKTAKLDHNIDTVRNIYRKKRRFRKPKQ